MYAFGDMSDYRHPDGRPDHSRADAALVAMLARVTRDVAQIDRIFRTSALMREKWDRVSYSDGRTYGEGVIWFVLRSANSRKDGERLSS
jgi:putative DNA primase/helicase